MADSTARSTQTRLDGIPNGAAPPRRGELPLITPSLTRRLDGLTLFRMAGLIPRDPLDNPAFPYWDQRCELDWRGVWHWKNEPRRTASRPRTGRTDDAEGLEPLARAMAATMHGDPA